MARRQQKAVISEPQRTPADQWTEIAQILIKVERCKDVQERAALWQRYREVRHEIDERILAQKVA